MSSIATAPYTYGEDGHMTGFTDDTTLFPVEGIAVANKTVKNEAVENEAVENKPVANKKRPREVVSEEKLPASEEKLPASEKKPAKRPRSASAGDADNIWGGVIDIQRNIVDPVVEVLEEFKRQNQDLDNELQRKLTRGNSDPSPSKRPEDGSEKYERMTYGELQTACKDRLLPVIGPKKELIAGLMKADEEWKAMCRERAAAKKKPEPKRPEAKKPPAETSVTIAVKGLTTSVKKKAAEYIENLTEVLTVNDGETSIDIEFIDVYNDKGAFEVELTLPVPALQNPEEVKVELIDWLGPVLDNSGNEWAGFSCSTLKDGKFTMTATAYEEADSSDDDDSEGEF